MLLEKLKIKIDDKYVSVDKGTKFYQLLDKNYKEDIYPIILAKFNNIYLELTDEIKENGDLVWIRLDNAIAIKAYRRALQFVFIKATLDLFNECSITIQHSIRNGLYGEVHKDVALNEEDIKLIKNRMMEIINKDIVIEKCEVKTKDAINIFKTYKMNDKVRLLSSLKNDNVKLYKRDDRYDYFYGNMVYSTGILKYFDLEYYDPGFVLNFPKVKEPTKVCKFVDIPQLSKVFKETKRWISILDVADVSSLNEKIRSHEKEDIIRVSEALHEKKIAQIADMILNKENTKIVLIAGPSSSGKTTFSKRLAIQLRVNGYKPLLISLDDYYIDRDKTPLDENGKPDFESINALDLEFFNNQLKDLLSNKAVKLPKYNFKTGKREPTGKMMQLGADDILVIEGIHGLNDKLSYSIPKEKKFKIYISALTQLDIDEHNNLPTTDVRLIRRIVRDARTRGSSTASTIAMWDSVRRGEETYIFPFQEQADVMFNSALIYEMSVLKQYAEPLLFGIDRDAPEYLEANRLLNVLDYFLPIPGDVIGSNSILREFIGGSCFNV